MDKLSLNVAAQQGARPETDASIGTAWPVGRVRQLTSDQLKEEILKIKPNNQTTTTTIIQKLEN